MKDSTNDGGAFEHAPAAAPIQRREQEGGDLSAVLDGSPRQLAQRRRIDAAFGPVAQREAALDDDELGTAQAKVAQRASGELDEEELGTAQAKAAPVQRQENRTGMPDGLKSGIESLSGTDLSDVRVHRNSSQPAQLNALAYAQGNDIHLGPGQEAHLPHEAWHVVQQREGRVQPTMQMQGVDINDDVGLEAEADRMGDKALSLGRDG
ncbi:DUF4157 domain-containing protein [Roseateles chitinivorans]|uniref:eCIS core domain-containing protein n=1 Tax=Roseateles chitinivorans TaxID=2917965 RepID=UPI003D67A314